MYTQAYIFINIEVQPSWPTCTYVYDFGDGRLELDNQLGDSSVEMTNSPTLIVTCCP